MHLAELKIHLICAPAADLVNAVMMGQPSVVFVGAVNIPSKYASHPKTRAFTRSGWTIVNAPQYVKSNLPGRTVEEALERVKVRSPQGSRKDRAQAPL